MSEAAVSKRTSETSPARSSEIFQPMFPLGRGFGLSPAGLNPFSMMRELATEMDRVFRSNGSTADIQAWTPQMDVQQCNGNLVVTADLPGVKKDEIKVEANDNTLVIEGERKQEHKEDHEGYHRWERSYGHFYRAIALPEGAKTDQVKAELKDGILKVSIPVPETKNKLRQIPVAG